MAVVDSGANRLDQTTQKEDMNRRNLVGALALGALSCHSAWAQSPAFPNRPVRIVSAFSVGSGPDAMLRMAAVGAHGLR